MTTTVDQKQLDQKLIDALASELAAALEPEPGHFHKYNETITAYAALRLAQAMERAVAALAAENRAERALWDVGL
jgi:hypothetical protein